MRIAGFIVALHQDIDNRIQWRKGVLLKNPSFNSQAVVRVNYQDRLLTIVVKGEQKRDYFAVIRKALQDIHASFEWKKPPVELVPLPDNPEFTVEYEELIGYEQMGKDDYPVGKLRKVYSVSELLNGIEKPEQRQNSDRHFHIHGDYIEGENMKIEQQTINGGNQQFADKIENYRGNKNMTTITQNISGTVHGSVIAAEKIENSFNSLQESKASDDAKTLLEQLLNEIKVLNGKVPEQAIQTLSEESETLITEAIKEQPRKKYLGLSLEGIKEAALTLKELGEPIINIATKLSPLLLGL